MKIRYNIADNKKIDYRKFALISASLIIVSLLFIFLGVHQISSSAQQFQAEKEELQAFKDKIDAINQKEIEQKQEISQIKKRWRKKQQFINNLIDDKLFPYIQKLDQLEKVLPAGVFIKNVSLSTKDKNNVNLSLGAISAQKLLQAYKVFLKYNLIIKKESEKKGIYNANIKIRLKNEVK
jgi:cell division protein FtsB